MFSTVLKFFMGPIGKWLGGGLVAAVLVGGVWLWHDNQFVHRVELEQWQNYANDLAQAYAHKEKLNQEYREDLAESDAVITEMEKELNDLLVEEASGDDPVVLDSSDVDKLRRFLRKR